MKSEHALNIVAMALSTNPEAIKGLCRERVALVETRRGLIEALGIALANLTCKVTGRKCGEDKDGHVLTAETMCKCDPCSAWMDGHRLLDKVAR